MIVWGRFKTKFRNIIIVSIYVPTDKKEVLYDKMQAMLQKLRKNINCRVKNITDDYNAKVGNNN